MYAYRRSNDSGTATIFVNFTGENAEFDSSLISDGSQLISSYGDEGEKGTLRPYESVIYCSY
ncbi:Beta-galactosidase C-terminal domain [Lachnospiraceae bacterium C1.1]